jgi:hypothetical protein
MSLGITCASLGREDEAVREAEQSTKLMPLAIDAIDGAYALIASAQIYTMVGKNDAALKQLEFILSLHAPKLLTPSLLRLDPIYDPLRSNPRFQALVGSSATDEHR